MFELCPLCLSGGPRSDRHGVIERHSTLALSGPFLDPGDIASHGAVEEYGPQIPTLGQRGTELQGPRPAEQTGPLRRQAVAYAASGSGKVAQAEATVKQLYADLVAFGYDGSYNRVAAFARDWK